MLLWEIWRGRVCRRGIGRIGILVLGVISSHGRALSAGCHGVVSSYLALTSCPSQSRNVQALRAPAQKKYEDCPGYKQVWATLPRDIESLIWI